MTSSRLRRHGRETFVVICENKKVLCLFFFPPGVDSEKHLPWPSDTGDASPSVSAMKCAAEMNPASL